MFKNVTSDVNFPKLEHNVLKLWVEIDAFKKRVDMNKGKKRWSFMDGPITANNPMGVHHAWGRTYKDLFQRYKTMNGYELRYQNGFDCQGLWIEVEVEKELGFKSKRDIEAFGISEFVRKCKQRALTYAALQVEQSIRLGYWMDWDNPTTLRFLADNLEHQEKITVKGPKGPVTDTAEALVSRLGSSQLGGSYFTFSDENNYTIWSALKKSYERGWIYKGRDVMPWCPRCSTSLSQHEIVTEGYRELTHLGITVRFPLLHEEKASLLVWTTTGWTLTSNMAAAVNPEMTYLKIRYNDECLYIGKAALERTFPKGRYEVEKELKGSEMEGWKYKGPFDDLPAGKEIGAMNAHCVIFWKDVSEEEGTGIVHIAPGCGREDLELGKSYGLPALAPLNEFGVFIDGFGRLSGVHVYDSAPIIVEDLRKKGLLFNAENYVHRYPVCWRCGSDLVFRLVDEWFISMGEKLRKPLEEISSEEKKRNLRYQIMDSAKKVRWIPEFGLQQELDWLANMDDWMISKKRYWGLALPIWTCSKCGHFDVIGSEEELKTRAVEGLDLVKGHTPHRPQIDAVKIRCSRCGTVASRIPDVGNPWLDAGIVSYSTLDYRHNRKYWKNWFPAELICESLPGQFRNWFYAMLALSTIMERETPFRNCFGYGVALAEDGREMHKSWGNAIWFDDAVETMGADVMRWMYCAHRPEINLLFGYREAEETKKRFLIPLWNIYSFFVTYANLDGWLYKSSVSQGALSLLDQWILSRLNVLIRDVTKYLDDFNPSDAAVSLEKFVDVLSTWYVRRSRRRFWKSEKDVDKNGAYLTLYTCLTTLAVLLCPFIPFTAEEIYQNLVRNEDLSAQESVHHNDWPVADISLIKEDLMKNMDLTIRICSLGRSARSKSGIKLRQPLSEVVVVAEEQILHRVAKLKDLILDELNVKKLTLTTQQEDLLQYAIKPLPTVLGRKYGRLFPEIKKAIVGMDSKMLASTLEREQVVDLEIDRHVVRLTKNEVEISTHAKDGYALSEEDNILVGINVVAHAELKREGLARDIIRRIQNQRKDAGFNIADQIETYYEGDLDLVRVFEDFEDYIAAETLSVVIHMAKPPEEAHVKEYKIADKGLRIGLVRIRNHEVSGS